MSLFRFLPEITRARGYHLYTSDGRRFLDMYLEEGRLVMGHRQAGYGLALKNNVDRGIFSPFPSRYTHRLKRAVQDIFGREKHVYLFRDSFSAEAALRMEDIEYSTLRPAEMQKGDGILVFILPVPEALAPGVVVSAEELDLEEDLISPVVAAGAEKGVRNYISFMKKSPSFDLGNDLKEALSEIWEIDGPYLSSRLSPADYAELFGKALESGLILSPYQGIPSVIPAVLSENDRKKLWNLTSF